MRRLLVAAVACVLLVPAPAKLTAQRTLTVTPSSADAAVSSLLDGYASGAAQVADLTRQPYEDPLSDLRRVAPRWVGPRTAPDTARRRLTVATYVVDLIDQNFDVIVGQGIGFDALDWACRLVREGAPSPAERDWHLALFAVLERLDSAPRVGNVGGLRRMVPGIGFKSHIDDAEARFPGEGQWALARAIEKELSTWPPPRDEEPQRFHAGIDGPVVSAFRLAIEHPDVASEAHLRLAYFQIRQGQYETALEELDRVGTPPDWVLRYWLHLFRGRALGRVKRPADAVASLNRALAEVPNAQTASLALASALVADRRSDEAADVVNRMLGADPPLDPWRFYGFPAHRHLDGLIAGLRRTIRP